MRSDALAARVASIRTWGSCPLVGPARVEAMAEEGHCDGRRLRQLGVGVKVN